MSGPFGTAPRRRMLWVLTAGLTVGPLVTYGIASMSVDIMSDTGIGVAEIGFLASSIFIGATVLSLALGAAPCRASPRSTMVLIFGGVALSMAILATAGAYPVMIAAMLVYAASLALGQPGTNTIIADHVPPHAQGHWVGIKQSGTQWGQLIAGAVYPGLAILVGWRWAFGISALVVAALLALGLRESRHLVPLPAPLPRTADTDARSSSSLLRQVGRYALMLVLFGTGASAVNVFVPLFAHERLGISTLGAGLTMVVTAALGVVARIAIGRWLGTARSRRISMLVLALGACTGSLVLLASGLLVSPVLLWAGVALHGAFGATGFVVATAEIIAEVDTALLARASALVAAGNFIGYALGPALVSALSLTPLGFEGGWALTVAVFLGAGAIALGQRRNGTMSM